MDKTVPLGRVKGTLTPPCSKSYAQRALAASLLCGETSVLRNLEFCDDTRSALRCIETLGARVKHVDASTLSIEGGLHPRGKVLHVGESGLATRLFTPIASLCGMPVTIEGQGTLLRRPMHMMIDPLRRLGVRVRDNDGYLPFEVRGPIRGGEIDVDGSVSSQFITGLLLALPLSQHDTTLHVRSAVSTPYLDMTVDTAARFGVEICHNDYKEFYIEGGQRYRPAFFSIEGDWSAAAMLLVAGAVAGEVTVKNVSMLSKQADTAICTALVRAGAAVINDEDSVTASHRPLRAFEFDATHCPDLFPALAALAAAGYRYNSSINPTWIPTRYNNLRAPCSVSREEGLTIYPVSVSAPFRVPLFWISLHVMPLPLYKLLCRSALRRDGHLNLYFHPWEFSARLREPAFGVPGYLTHCSGTDLQRKFIRLLEWLKARGCRFLTTREYLGCDE